MGRALQVGVEHRQQLVGDGPDFGGQGRIPVIGAWRGDYVVGHAGILAAGAWPVSGRIPVFTGEPAMNAWKNSLARGMAGSAFDSRS